MIQITLLTEHVCLKNEEGAREERGDVFQTVVGLRVSVSAN